MSTMSETAPTPRPQRTRREFTDEFKQQAIRLVRLVTTQDERKIA